MVSPPTLVTEPFSQMKATLRSARVEGALKACWLPPLGAVFRAGVWTRILVPRAPTDDFSRMVLALVALWEAMMRVSTPYSTCLHSEMNFRCEYRGMAGDACIGERIEDQGQQSMSIASASNVE